jgi:hypothetical protein
MKLGGEQQYFIVVLQKGIKAFSSLPKPGCHQAGQAVNEYNFKNSILDRHFINFLRARPAKR